MKSFQETPMNNNKGDEPEESTWTFYFEEFLWQNNQDQEMVMSCNETVNCLVPDTASSGIIKRTIFIQDDEAKKMTFKKRKTNTMMIDDSLEDTASSPLSSPKVTYFDQVTTKNKKKNKNKNKKTMPISEEKVATYEEQNKRNYSNMELKKRGLCLVPLSSLANYLS